MWTALTALLACTADDPAEGGEPGGARRGLLQLSIEHNLEDDACLADGSCELRTEHTDDVDAWIGSLRQDAEVPVLHWDRGVPWSVFAEPPSDGADALTFYEDRMDPSMLAWIDAYAGWFEEAGAGFLAVSLLAGTRDSLAPELLADGTLVELAGRCPDLGPEDTFTSADGTPFELGPAWARFTGFLAEKLHPDQVALLVETNLFLEACPGQWGSLVDLYHDSYDASRAELGPEVTLFATLSLPPLLGYTDGCGGELAYSACNVEPPAPPTVDTEACFPGDATALDDLAEGDRMDLLALSLYPDGLGMALPGIEDARVRIWLEGTDPAGACDVQARLPAWVDPLAAVERLGWSGPVALAETSARSCPTWVSFDDGVTQAVVEMPGTSESQVAWVEEIFAQPERFSFVNQSFERDYAPLGLWVVEEGVMDAGLYNIFNMWPCSGLRDEDGVGKAALEAWRAAGAG